MDGKRIARMLLVVAGAAAVILLLFLLLVFVNGGEGFAACTWGTPLGWVIPPLAGLIIGGVAWMLLFRAPYYSEHSEESTDLAVACFSCGRRVMVGWRLCPYCGAILPRAEPTDAV